MTKLAKFLEENVELHKYVDPIMLRTGYCGVTFKGPLDRGKISDISEPELFRLQENFKNILNDHMKERGADINILDGEKHDLINLTYKLMKTEKSPQNSVREFAYKIFAVCDHLKICELNTKIVRGHYYDDDEQALSHQRRLIEKIREIEVKEKAPYRLKLKALDEHVYDQGKDMIVTDNAKRIRGIMSDSNKNPTSLKAARTNRMVFDHVTQQLIDPYTKEGQLKIRQGKDMISIKETMTQLLEKEFQKSNIRNIEITSADLHDNNKHHFEINFITDKEAHTQPKFADALKDPTIHHVDDVVEPVDKNKDIKITRPNTQHSISFSAPVSELLETLKEYKTSQKKPSWEKITQKKPGNHNKGFGER